VNEESNFIQSAFTEYANTLKIKVHEQLAMQAGSLWFVPVEGSSIAMKMLAAFSFIRVLRPMPLLRGIRPVSRSPPISMGCQLPNEMPISNEPRVAILDGGLPEHHPLTPMWLNSYKISDPTAKDQIDALEHGLAVSSAFLFGPLTPGGVAPRPYAPINHVRVLDDHANTEDPLQLYRTLGHIEEVLMSRQYDFINLSLGPDLPIEDEDVHSWTSVIDDLLCDLVMSGAAKGHPGIATMPTALHVVSDLLWREYPVAHPSPALLYPTPHSPHCSSHRSPNNRHDWKRCCHCGARKCST